MKTSKTAQFEAFSSLISPTLSMPNITIQMLEEITMQQLVITHIREAMRDSELAAYYLQDVVEKATNELHDCRVAYETTIAQFN